MATLMTIDQGGEKNINEGVYPCGRFRNKALAP